MKNHERSIEHHQSQANPAPKQNLPKKSQILVKSIGPIWFWEYHGDGLNFEEMLIDVTAETASKEWEIKLVLDSRTQAEEFITKLRGALAQESEEATGTPTDPKDEDELHELN